MTVALILIAGALWELADKPLSYETLGILLFLAAIYDLIYLNIKK